MHAHNVTRHRSRFTFLRLQAWLCCLGFLLPAFLVSPLAVARAGQAEVPLRVRSAEVTELDEGMGRLVARGNVVVEYGQYTVSADVLEADLEEQSATFRGRVTLTTAERTIEGTLLSLNLRTHAYELEGARILIPPQDLQMGAAAPIYAVGARIRGEPGRVVIGQGGVTTCDLEAPHFLFDARDVDIIPAQRLKARNVSVYALGRKLLTLPGMTIPLRALNEQSTRLVPVVGQSVDEGYFVKTAYFYLLGSLVGNLRLDLMTRKGIGVGLDQPYTLPASSGAVHLYYLNDRNNRRQDFNARSTHRQRIGEFDISFNGDMRRNSLDMVAADINSSSLLTNLTVGRRGADGSSTDFGINRNENTYADRTTGQWAGRFRHSQSVAGVRANLNMNLYQPFGHAFARSGQLTSRLDLSRPGRAYDIDLVADRITTLGGPATYFPGTQRLPELRLSTSTARLLQRESFLARVLPMNAQLTIGNVQEQAFSPQGEGARALTNRLRTDLHLAASPRIASADGNLSLYAPMDFRQIFYKQDEAQWVANVRPSFTYQPSPGARISLNHSFMAQNGFTPFQFDFYGSEINRLSLDMTLGPGLRPGLGGVRPGFGASSLGSVGALAGHGGHPGAIRGLGALDPLQAGRLNFSFGASYDFERDRASDLVVRAQYQPTAHYLLSLDTRYDWLGKDRFTVGGRPANRLRDVRGRLRVDYGPSLQLSLGALWDTNRDRFGTVRSALNWQVNRDWNLQGLYGATASGFGLGQRYAQFMLTRDLHCWEISAIYRSETFGGRPRSDFRVLMSLKAFPTNKEFGIGMNGQLLTTDIGSMH